MTHFRLWPIATYCAAHELGRYRGKADVSLVAPPAGFMGTQPSSAQMRSLFLEPISGYARTGERHAGSTDTAHCTVLYTSTCADDVRSRRRRHRPVYEARGEPDILFIRHCPTTKNLRRPLHRFAHATTASFPAATSTRWRNALYLFTRRRFRLPPVRLHRVQLPLIRSPRGPAYSATYALFSRTAYLRSRMTLRHFPCLSSLYGTGPCSSISHSHSFYSSRRTRCTACGRSSDIGAPGPVHDRNPHHRPNRHRSPQKRNARRSPNPNRSQSRSRSNHWAMCAIGYVRQSLDQRSRRAPAVRRTPRDAKASPRHGC